MTTKALSYLRVSSASQVDGDGFPRQREAVRRYAAAHGLELVGEYRDEGVSGTTSWADRPGMLALIERLASNGVRVVLVEKADRLARDLIEGELILRELRSQGVQVLEVESGADLTAGDEDNPTAKLIRQVLGAVAEFEKSALVGKLRAARKRKRAHEGRCEGRKPFGHYPGEADTLERIRQLNRKPRGEERLTVYAIAKALNAEGRSTRTGKAWSPTVVGRIMEREGLTR